MQRFWSGLASVVLVTTTLVVVEVVGAAPVAAAPPTGGAGIFIAGDVSGRVDVFDGTGTKTDDWPGNFTTSDRLAIGDVTGDGIDEVLIAGDATGVIDIFDQAGTPIRSFNGNYTIGDGFAVGDVNGDGTAEILIAGDVSGTLDIFDQFGGRPLPAFGSGFTLSDALATGDLDNNGTDEILIAGDATGTIDIFNGTGGRPFPAFNGNYTIGDGFATGDINGNGTDEILIAGDVSGTLDVFDQFGGRPVPSFNSGFNSSDALASGDVTGDGTDEILVAGDVSGVIDIFDASGARPLPAFDGDYTIGDGFALTQEGYADSDRDGLLDQWEINGFDADNNGSVDVNLPAMGANPNHKDLFLEFDWVTGQQPNQAAITALKQAFALAPANAGGSTNPDGVSGITVHVDTGGLVDPSGTEDGSVGACNDGVDNGGDGSFDAADPSCLVGDNLGGGNDIGNVNVLPLDSSFYNAKGANFAANRANIFRYAISGDPTDPSPATGGRGEIGGNDFIEYNHDGGTIMHELGHNLNLHHGGDVDTNCKPNYVSVMNYDLQFGIPQVGGSSIIDYSPPRTAVGRGSAPLPQLKENALNDNTVLDPTDGTNRFVFVNGLSQKVQNNLNTGENWAGDSDPPTESNNTVNIDTSVMTGVPPTARPAACTNGSNNETLNGFDDWSVISVPFRQFGDSNNGAINPENDIVPTLQDRDALVQAINTTDLSVATTASPQPVAAGTNLTYSITVTNNGPNPAATTQVVQALAPGTSYVNGTGGCVTAPGNMLNCTVGDLVAGTSRQFTVTIAVAPDLVFNNGGPKIISSTVTVDNLAGPDPTPANDSVTVNSQVVAVADLSVGGVHAVAPPTEVLIGTPATVAVAATVHNSGPSGPIDATVTDVATASPGASITPAIASLGVSALGLNETRPVSRPFTIACAAPGSHTYSVSRSVVPAHAVDSDPNAANNSGMTTFTVDCVVPVTINIKPGGFPNPINRGAANVPLAVLTTTAGEYGNPLAFNATTIDPLSVHFGTRSLVNSGGGTTELHGRGHLENSVELNEVSHDGDTDMVLHFPPAGAGLALTTTEACVKGEFTSGPNRFRFFGCDAVVIIK